MISSSSSKRRRAGTDAEPAEAQPPAKRAKSGPASSPAETAAACAAASRSSGEPAYWLLKSEPDCFSIDELQAKQHSIWDGVRNHQAKNFLKAMAPGDVGFFYHSSVDPPGIVGLMRVSESNVVDPTQFDRASPYFDARASPAQPRWHTVQVEFVARYSKMLTLAALREEFGDTLTVTRKGNRLSVMPVQAEHAKRMLALIEQIQQ